ncbi:flagellar hook-basal body complex protein [Limnohabitans radicicola]|uniref:Flagellar hook protein FlgE n=1 Tax=Limnohabitans radicicola TaxID=2771427 RepID=A0A927FE62_9BURK|nr:flagellar hook-basal body complex protein [Limnohabitans radicicola]MBD8048947.1 flagellar hook-basal body complex protein [Limnohabitans radicicola]
MSFYTSLTGLNAATAQLGVTSNNIANVGTTGFKRSRADFGDIFSTSPLQKSSSNIGQGVSLKQVSQEFSQGNVSTSGNSLDLAITGDGFFPLRSPDGLQEVYTRNGSFMLNDQNNVVNSAGQRLLSAAVDSSGKADLSKLSVLNIPPKTSGMAKETTKIQLGLNLPADSTVITAEFDRTNPATYNKSTALTVYDSGGNGYLATVYYVKTQGASPSMPQSKWQTYVYVGNSKVTPSLMQATDKNGQQLYVNKYGDIKPESAVQDELVTGKTMMFSLNQLTDQRVSQPANLHGEEVTVLTADMTPTPADVNLGKISLGGAASSTGTAKFKLSVDGSADVDIQLDETTAKTPEEIAARLANAINKAFGDDALVTPADPTATPPVVGKDDRRYGIDVKYDTAAKQFIIYSGTTGDTSSIKLTVDDTDPAATQLGLISTETPASTIDAVRGKPSAPAVLNGNAITVNTSGSVSINDLNNKFSITVNGVKGTITLPAPNNTGTITDLAQTLQTEINKLEDPNTGKPIRGVTVNFDAPNNRLVFSTGNTGDSASIKVTGSADWGLSNSETARGSTSNWYSMHQFTETADGLQKPQFIDENGKQTALRDGFNTLPSWSPIYLDRGELSFDLSGKTLSPRSNMLFDTAFLEGGKGALTMQIDFTQSTQYSSPFAVLSQSQDGAPEGDLMGLDIGVDGLVSANYSNGSQQSLGKIVLANFSSPTGLRQVGDASYLASATSGKPKIGEGGSAGFGGIRAGATERANVDLTKELVDLITAQRNFQANAKAIETSSTMTQAIVNIRS